MAAIKRAAGYAPVLPSTMPSATHLSAASHPTYLGACPFADPSPSSPSARTSGSHGLSLSGVEPPAPPPPASSAPSEPHPAHAALAAAVVEFRLFVEEQTREGEGSGAALPEGARAQLSAALAEARERLARCTARLPAASTPVAGAAGEHGADVAAILAVAHGARETRLTDAASALQGLQSRLATLQAAATEERNFERPTGDEVAAADQALRNLGSAAAFELEQVLWRGGLRGAALEARVASELEGLRAEWLLHKAEAEARMQEEERRLQHEMGRRAARTEQAATPRRRTPHEPSRATPHLLPRARVVPGPDAAPCCCPPPAPLSPRRLVVRRRCATPQPSCSRACSLPRATPALR